ncbi:MAG: hypothetical protein AAF922_01905 [Pseudomonadota bacterium]
MQECLIAETDEFGNVEWVWVSRGDTRRTKPLDRARGMTINLEDCEIAGASRAAVREWLRAGSYCTVAQPVVDPESMLGNDADATSDP